MNKLEFLTDEFTSILSALDATNTPAFGKMNFHQMVEHMSYAFQQASGLIPLESNQDEATTEKMFNFMMSDKPFKENTPNRFLPDEPILPKTTSVQAAIDALQKDIENFVLTFKNQEEKRIANPFFGNLNFEEWTQLLYKHSLHHLKQFGFE